MGAGKTAQPSSADDVEIMSLRLMTLPFECFRHGRARYEKQVKSHCNGLMAVCHSGDILNPLSFDAEQTCKTTSIHNFGVNSHHVIPDARSVGAYPSMCELHLWLAQACVMMCSKLLSVWLH